jgi:peptide/nickel transport system permease protein
VMSEQIKQRELKLETVTTQIAVDTRLRENILAPVAPSDTAKKRGRRLQRPGLLVWIAMAVLALVMLAAVLADLIAPINNEELTFLTKLKPPFWMEGADSRFPLGTDAFGHNILTYLIHGARTSLIVGLVAPTISALIGISLGLWAGVKGKRIETVIMRAVDIQIAFPFLVLALVLVAIFRPSMFSLLGVLSIAGWASYARVARGEVKGVKAKEYAQAAVALGIPGRRIALRHILPNITASLIVLWTFQVGTIIIAEASLSFLGLGIPQPAVSWGGMINDGRNYLDTNWWVPFWPSLTLTLVVISINTVGDWVRDVLDPTTRR